MRQWDRKIVGNGPAGQWTAGIVRQWQKEVFDQWYGWQRAMKHSDHGAVG